MSTIFISYSRADEEKVANIVKDIKSLGHDAWFDHELSGGQNWWDKILEEIRSADIFVFILSPESRESKACSHEYEYAHALGKPVIPIQVKEGVSTSLLPPALSQIQIVNYVKVDRDADFRLARALTSISAFKPLPDPLPEPPEAPLSCLGVITQQVESNAELGFEQQSALLLNIKKCLSDLDVNENDAVTLLKRFRKRPDLLANIADEVDSIISKTKKAKINTLQAINSAVEKINSPTSTAIKTSRNTEVKKKIFDTTPEERAKDIGIIVVSVVIIAVLVAIFNS